MPDIRPNNHELELVKRDIQLKSDFTENASLTTPLFPITQAPSKPRFEEYSQDTQDMAYQTLSSGEQIARYDTYLPGINNEERLAQKQTTGEKWTNGTLKLLGKTGTAILGGTIGVADSLIQGVAKGSLSEAYNTNFNNWLDDLNTKLDYQLPNYYTEQEKNASFLGQTTQANFWADKVFGGVSFTLGALVSEGIWGAATGGVGLLAAEGQLARLAKWTSKGVGGEAKLAKALNYAKNTAKGSVDSALESGAFVGKEFGIISEASKSAAIGGYRIKKLGDIALVATRSAGFEAGMEARQYMNSTEHDWLENYEKVNGTQPSTEEYAQFKDALTTSANAVFGANMIIVGGSNIAQFGNALLGKSTNPLIGNNILKRNLLGVGFDKTVSAEGKVVYTALEATKAQRIAGKTWGVLGAAIPESQEEMSQAVVSQTAENYMMSAFDPKKINTTYGVAEAFTDALNTTYGSQEGWTEGLIGAIVGVVGAGASSRFKFGDIAAEREDIQRTVDYANKFTAENHWNNVIANTKMLAAQENKDKAIQRGDVVGEILSDAESTLAYTERNVAIGNTKEGIKDFERQVNAISDEDLAIELDLDNAEEAATYKAQKIADFKDLTAKHEKNLNFAQSLLGEKEIAGLDNTTTRELTRAVAYSMTMGEKAMQINQDLVSHVKNLVAESVDLQGVTDAMDVQQIIDLAPKEKTLKLSQLNLQLFNLDKKEKSILNREFEASKLTDTEDNKARQNALVDVAQELVEVQNEKELIRQQKQIALDAIGIRNYTDATVTVDMFDNQNENIEKLKETLKSIRVTNPERFNEIQKALEAQSKAVQHIKNYRKTVNAVTNPNTRVKILNGWVTKLLNKNTKLSEGTGVYFQDVLEKYNTDTIITFQENDNVRERKAFERGEEVSEEYKQQLGEAVRAGRKLNSTDQDIYNLYKKEIQDNAVSTIKDGTPEQTNLKEVDTLKDLKDKVKEIISSNDYLTQYFGTDLAEQGKTKPSENDVKEYEELLSKIDRRVEPNIDRIVSRPTGFYRNIGLIDAELNRFKELQTTLNDWLTLEGTFDGDSQSVADMLDLIDALETRVEAENVKTDLLDRDYKSALEATAEQENSAGSSVRGLQTPTNALATIKSDNIRFSHITVQTLASFFPNSNLIINDNNTFEIDLSNGQKLSGKINEKGGQDINYTDWKSVQEQSTVLIKDFGTKSVAISRMLGLDSQGNELYENVASDFDYQQTDGTNLEIDVEEVNRVKNGDELDLFVSSTDAFNSRLSSKELSNQIHIYVMKNGKLLGSLPASYSKESVDGIGIPLVDLRKSAAEFSKNEGKKALIEGETLIKLPQKMNAQITFIGAPQITLQKNENGEITTKNNPFTKESLEKVVGQGYIENGQITSTINIDVNQFIRKVSNGNTNTKIPFVAFNYNGKVTAFPVNLNSFTSNRAEGIFDNATTTSEKAKVLVNTLIQNGFNPQDYKIDFTDKEGWLESEETVRALEDLSNIKETVSIERFATKNYNKENLINDATIAIDIANQPFQASKIMLGLSSKIDTDVLGYREFLSQQEDREQELRAELNELAKQVESRYLSNEDLDNNFTQTFDENPIVEGDSDIIRRRNINTLKRALKGASKKTKAVIGDSLFNKAKKLFSDLEFSTNKIKSLREEIRTNPYYQEADSTFITVDEQGNLENPVVNQIEAVEQLGGTRTVEELEERLDNSDLDYLKTTNIEELQSEMSQFVDVPVKIETPEGLVDKLNTEVRDTLIETIDIEDPISLRSSLRNIAGYSESVWESSKQEINILLKDIEKKALDSNIDLRGIENRTQEEILEIVSALDTLTFDEVTEQDLQSFIDAYLKFNNITEEPQTAKIKVEDRFKEEVLLSLDTTSSEYKLFKDSGLIKVQEGVYIKTDSNVKSLAEVESLAATNPLIYGISDINNIDIIKEDLNDFVEDRMSDVITEDAEFDSDVVKKLIYYKNYFGVKETKPELNLEKRLSKIQNVTLENPTDVIVKARNKQLREVHPALQNLVFNQKGITLKYTDAQSVSEMNDYLKEDEALKNYFLLSRNTNFDVEAEESNDVILQRDRLINGETNEQFRGDYRTIDENTLQVKTSEDFITIGNQNYERIQRDFFVKLEKNTSDYFTINNDQPTLNINVEDYTSISSEGEIKVNNKYSAEESKKIDENNRCS
ncbi:MAG TPA: hypothetical protein VLA48_03390 [Nitrososphaeraceae archaeon]|nr:hypothetical protein [Nitrososphaeraceae archaeon]